MNSGSDFDNAVVHQILLRHSSDISCEDSIMRYANRSFTTIGFLGGFLLAGAVSSADLQVGDVVPEFKCRDAHDKIWDSREHVGKKLVVVYFYPSDFAFCCTRQAKCYRDSQRELADFDVEVVGISGDSVEAHQLFKETLLLNQTLLSDTDGSVARQFGVPLRAGGKAMPVNAAGQALIGANGAAVHIPRDFTASRWTFVIDRHGRIIYRETDVSPKRDTQEVLEFLCGRTSETSN